jgi:hypothetical protein
VTQLRRHASPTAFLYTHPTNTTSPGDSIDPTDPVSRLLHDYSDSGADDYNLTSTYEGTADTIAVSAKVHTTAEPVSSAGPVQVVVLRPGVRSRSTGVTGAEQSSRTCKPRINADQVIIATNAVGKIDDTRDFNCGFEDQSPSIVNIYGGFRHWVCALLRR